MNMVPIGKIVDFIGGGTPSRDVNDYWNGGIPWASVKDFKGLLIDSTLESITLDGLSNSSSTLIPAGHVIMPTRMALGKAAINSIDVAINQDLKALKPKIQIDTRYLLHAVLSRSKEIQSHGKGATVQGITIERLRAIQIPLPPLEEQRRIAGILDKCNAIQAADIKRRDTLGRFQASYFLHLFGEPSTASESWPLKTIESCSAAIQTGPFGSLLHQSDYIRGGIPILNPKHIVNGMIACGENETIGKDKARELTGYQLEKGDVLLARRGEMGRCAVVTSREDGWLCGTGSMFIRPLGGTLAPEYLCALLSSQYMRSRLEKIAIGTTLLNLNATIIGGLLIPVPPIDLQHGYTDVLARLSALGDMTTRSAFARSTATASIQNKLLSAAVS